MRARGLLRRIPPGGGCLLPISTLLLACLAVDPQLADAGGNPLVWSEAQAAHLLNRAGLAATREEVEESAHLGLEGTLARLFHPEPAPAAVGESSQIASGDVGRPTLRGGLIAPQAVVARLDARRDAFLEAFSDHVLPVGRFGEQWIGEMLSGADPLRDHMTLFWHGHFTSSFREVGDPFKMTDQIRFLRENALGRFAMLVRGIARDPAMLQYLDNKKNVQDHPNENWARELMELFTLGDGNYTEVDVKEVSRAFTGWSDEERRFAFHRLDHDEGQKTVLGVTGELDGDDVIDVILAQPACGRFLARKLITFFEGVEPERTRVETYAELLRGSDYDVRGFLDHLFRDPAFYRDEVRGRRVAGPVEYFVGASRRLGIEAPAALLISLGDLCGQRLLYPPSVKGWDQGLSWITTGSLVQRSNGAGILLGLVSVDELVVDDEFGSAAAETRPRAPVNYLARTGGLPMLQFVQSAGWEPGVSIQARLVSAGTESSDGAIAAALLRILLAVPASEGSRDTVRNYLHGERALISLAEADLLRPSEDGEHLLRRAAHLVLSLPEAQLN